MTSPSARVGLRDWLWLLVLALATFLVYLPGLHIWYYGDDFQYLFEDPSQRILYFFHHRNLFHGFYRPVNSAIIAIVQTLWGMETWPIHALNVLVHAGLAWLVYRFMLRENFSVSAAVIASGFMVVSQANSGAVLSVDTFSQISGTFFGCLTLWLLYRANFGPAAGADAAGADAAGADATGANAAGAEAAGSGSGASWLRRFLPAILSCAVCLASKETSVAYLPMVALLLLAKNWRLAWGARITRTVLDALPFVVLGLAYVWWRAAIGLSQPTSSGGTYGFSLGLNVVRNFAQFAFAALIPASSASAFLALKARDYLVIGAMVAGSLAFLGATVLGLWRSARHRSFVLLGAFSLIGLFPAMLMNHVGELYLYNSMPFVAVLVGAAFARLVERTSGSKLRRIALALFMICLALSHVYAVQTKAAEMVANGDRARRLLPQLLPYAKRTPEGRFLLLLNPPHERPEYSVFIVNGFSVFKWGEQVVWQQAGRTGIDVRVVDQAELADRRLSDGALIVTLRNDSVVVYREP